MEGLVVTVGKSWDRASLTIARAARKLAAADAIWRLEAAGLIHRHGQYLWPTRAAIRAIQIDTSI